MIDQSIHIDWNVCYSENAFYDSSTVFCTLTYEMFWKNINITFWRLPLSLTWVLIKIWWVKSFSSVASCYGDSQSNNNQFTNLIHSDDKIWQKYFLLMLFFSGDHMSWVPFRSLDSQKVSHCSHICCHKTMRLVFWV